MIFMNFKDLMKAIAILLIYLIGMVVAINTLSSCSDDRVNMLNEPVDGPQVCYVRIIDKQGDFFYCEKSSHSYSACPWKNKYNSEDIVLMNEVYGFKIGDCAKLSDVKVVGTFSDDNGMGILEIYQSPDVTLITEP